MINLLPSEDYNELHAARHNVLLVRLLIGAVVCLIGVIFTLSSTYFLINMQEKTALAAKEKGEKSLNKFANVERQTKDFQNNLKTAKQILDKSISYRTMLINIAQALPDDAIISGLQLSPGTIGTPYTITVNTTSYAKATALKDTLNSSSIAENVSIGGVSTETNDANSPTTSKYPVSVQLNITFTKDLLTPTWESTEKDS